MDERGRRIAALLERCLDELSLPLPEGALERFVRLDALLQEANRHMNLTALCEPEEVVKGHYRDALLPLTTSVAGDLHGRVIDVGTGAGFPGLPLLIMRPELELCLLDAQRKRCDFVEEALRVLGLKARVEHGRAEDWGRGAGREAYELVTARALAPLPLLLEYLTPFAALGGHIWAYKGPGLTEEAEEAREAMERLGVESFDILPLPVPGDDRVRLLWRGEKSAPTPPRYPRRAGIPEKKPIGSQKSVENRGKC